MNPSQTTLREWYDGHFVRLYHADARAGTIEQYRVTIAIWERFTKNPMLADIDQLVLAEFKASCPGAAATVAKHARHLNHLLGKLGPPGPRNRDALGLLPMVPWCRPPRTNQRLPNVPTTNEVEQFIQRAPICMAFFAVLAATTGSRQTAIRSLSEQAIDANAQIIRFPAAGDKRRQERLKPIPRVTMQWIQRHRRRLGTFGSSRRNFSRIWNPAAAEAGVPTLRPHGLKRWWGAELVRHGATPWAVKYALDHAQSDVTGMHYIHPLDELAGLVNRITLPSAFAERLANRQTQLQF